MKEFLPKTKYNAKLSHDLCTKGSSSQDFCSNFLFLIMGFNMKELDKDRLPIMLSHTPAGASVKEFLHLGQLIEAGWSKHIFEDSPLTF